MLEPPSERTEAMVRLTAADGFTLDAFRASAGSDRAGGILASETVAKAEPDGYTLLFVTNGNSVSESLFDPALAAQIRRTP